MKISVAMAVYNGEDFIEEQLESIRTQSLQADEVRICDDCSKDHTVEVVQSYIAKHKLEQQWTITVNERNVGYASNFMKAIGQTTGDLIFFCDQDDIWMRDRVRRMCDLMVQNPEILLLGSEYEPFSESKDSCEVPGWELKMMRCDDSLEHKEFTAENIFIGCQGCTMCVRRSLIASCLPYWHEGWAHDEFVWKMALCLNGLYVYHRATLKRRLHASNASLKKMHTLPVRIRFLEELLKSHQAALRLAEHIGLGKREQKLLRDNITATKLRIELLQKKRLVNLLPLCVCYRHCYHKKKSILMELFLTLRG